MNMQIDKIIPREVEVFDLFLRSCVYELVVRTQDDGSENVDSLVKQTNPDMQISRNYKSTVVHDVTCKDIIDHIKAQYTAEEANKIHWMLAYPLLNDTDTTKMDFIVMNGIRLLEIPANMNKTVIVPGDATQEEIDAEIKRQCGPRTERQIFVMIMPISDKFSLDLSITHLGSQSINHVKTSQKTEDDARLE